MNFFILLLVYIIIILFVYIIVYIILFVNTFLELSTFCMDDQEFMTGLDYVLLCFLLYYDQS